MTNTRLILIACCPVWLYANGLPEWVLEPQMSGYICETGGANDEKIATINAKAALSKVLQTRVTSISKSTATADKSEFCTVSAQSSSELIKNAKIVDKITINGQTYVRLCIKPNHEDKE